MNGDTDKMKKDGLVSVIIPVYKAEKFIDNPAADFLLSRPYRKPFVVPEQV